MPPTTRRQSRFGLQTASKPETTSAKREDCETDAGIMYLGNGRVEGATMGMIDLPLDAGLVGTGEDERIYDVEVSGILNELEVFGGLHRSDDEDEGVELTVGAFHESSRDEFEDEKGSEDEDEVKVEDEIKEYDSEEYFKPHGDNTDDPNVSRATLPAIQGFLYPTTLERPNPWATPNPTAGIESTAKAAIAPLPHAKYYVRYRCAGWNTGCEARFWLRNGELMRCKECGCFGMYKLRTRRMVQFEAR